MPHKVTVIAEIEIDDEIAHDMDYLVAHLRKAIHITHVGVVDLLYHDVERVKPLLKQIDEFLSEVDNVD